MIMLLMKCITCIRGKKGNRIIAPVIVQLHAIHHTGTFHFIKFKNRHEFYRIDSQIFQIRNFLPQTFKCSPAFYAGGRIFGKSPDMHLINHQIFKFVIQIPIPPPVKITLHHTGFVDKILSAFRFFSPVSLTRNSFRIWIKKRMFSVKQ